MNLTPPPYIIHFSQLFLRVQTLSRLQMRSYRLQLVPIKFLTLIKSQFLLTNSNINDQGQNGQSNKTRGNLVRSKHYITVKSEAHFCLFQQIKHSNSLSPLCLINLLPSTNTRPHFLSLSLSLINEWHLIVFEKEKQEKIHIDIFFSVASMAEMGICFHFLVSFWDDYYSNSSASLPIYASPKSFHLLL